MSSIAMITGRLQRSLTEFLVPLQTVGVVDEAAFRQVELCATELAEHLKGSEELPRIPINELYETVKLLLGESEYHPTKNLGALANRLEKILALILRGESPSDRVPGVPRIL